MKKILSFLLVLCLATGVLAACGPATPAGPDTPNTPDGPATPDTPKPEEPQVPVSYVQTYPYTDENGALHIRYQDTYTFEDLIATVQDQQVTSTVCGKEEADEKVLRHSGRQITAVGCGSAVVQFRRESLTVIVDPSPINLLFVTGQSNASADWSFYGNTPEAAATGPTYAKYYLRSAPTMAYFTWTGQGLSLAGADVAANYVPTTLHWETIKQQSFSGCNPTVLAQENSGFGQAGWSAALANEWIAQTGERVWIVNASHGGHAIAEFLPSEDGTPIDNDYYQALSVFRLAIQTVAREVEAGHFSLNHMAYYWFQGESDRAKDDAYYLSQFAKVHAGFMQDLVFRCGEEEKNLEYCGIMTLRSCNDSIGNSEAELYMVGPRLAQYAMGGQTEGLFQNVFIASRVTEEWVGGDENVERYFKNTYGSEEAFYEKFGYEMPKTMYEVHPNIHYLMKGHNEMGMDAARNSLRIINITQPEKNYRLSYGAEEETRYTILEEDGVTPLGSTLYLDIERGAILYPAVTPTYAICRGVKLVSETEGLAFSGYTLKATGEQVPATLTFSLYLNQKKAATYTVAVTLASRFSQNRPTYTAAEGGYTFLSHSGPWQCGYLRYLDGGFVAFDKMEEHGWLYNGRVLWGEGSQGGFYMTDAMKVGLSSNKESASAIAYTAERTGEIALRADMFSPNLNNVYLAVAVNGEMVWPYAGAPLSAKANWYLAEKGVDDTTTLNEAWDGLTISVQEGDRVAFLLRAADGSGQTILYPVVYYLKED